MPALNRRCARLYLALLGSLLGCAGADRAVPLVVVVVDDRGEALAEVPLQRDGALLARSDAEGRARLVRAQLGRGARLGVHCPEAYRPAAPITLTDALALSRTLTFVCRPRLRTLAVVAYAPGSPGALVRADAQGLGRIAADGTLHAVLRRPPGELVTLTLEGEPAHARTVRVADRDEIMLLDAAGP